MVSNAKQSLKSQPIISDISKFDRNSGSTTERLLFNNRRAMLIICAALTIVLGFFSRNLQLNANFEATIPTKHPYIQNFIANKGELAGLGNAIRIVVANEGPSIYEAKYLSILENINNEVFLIPGVDRAFMKSLWTPATRWVGVTEEGLEGGPVVPEGYDGTSEKIDQLKANVARSGEVGQLVAYDQRSSLIYVPLLEKYPDGAPFDYGKFDQRIEQLRTKYESQGIRLHIVGFAKVVGDLISGVREIILFFAGAVFITTIVLYWHTRCIRSTLLVVSCSLVAVVWQVGLIQLLGYALDPYSVLVPFLVFAIGMSHGAQKMNGIMQDIGRGTHRVIAARYTFRRLFLAGLTALVCDAVGFAVLTLIKIQVIQDLAVIASIGVAVLIFTNLILLPILLSFVGVSTTAATRSLKGEEAALSGTERHQLWRFLDLFTHRRWAAVALITGLMLAISGALIGEHLKIGDLDEGAPELRADSRYNLDNQFVGQHYGASSDIFAVMVKTPDGGCSDYGTLSKIDSLERELGELDGVDSTNSLALLNRRVLIGLNEGNPKWYELIHSQSMINTITSGAPRGLYNDVCNLLTVYVYLKDHKSDTLTRVVEHIVNFARANDTDDVKFMLAAGNAGIEAATNIVVKKANREMLFWVYGAVIVLCLITFKSWRAVVCAVLPLMLTSILCEALMVSLNIGVKVATLPVIALGVGIGVDYALYILSITMTELRTGSSLSEAYYRSLLFTGRVVLLTGITLAAGVATWAYSPIKFQADMGVLLAFMFTVNMLGALILLPALAHFVLKPQSAELVELNL